MKEAAKKGLVYGSGIIITGLSIIPANLPFSFYLNRLTRKGQAEKVFLFVQNNSLDDLPLTQFGKFFYTFFPFLFLLTVLLILWKVFHGKKTLSLFTGASHFRFGLFFRAFLLWTALSLGADLILFFLKPENYQFHLSPVLWMKTILWGVIFIVPQITMEEIFFRSYLLKGGTALLGNPVIPLILISLCFGLLHGTNPEVKSQGPLLMIPQYAGMGLFLAILAWKSNGLEIPMGIHLSNNFWGMLIVNSGGSAFATNAPVIFLQWNGYLSLAALITGISFFTVIYVKSGFFSHSPLKNFFLDN